MNSDKKYGLILFIVLFFLSYSSQGQDELDFKPMASEAAGLGFINADSTVLVNFRFRMQNRIGVTTNSLSDLTINTVEARVRRLRLRMDGYFLTPKFGYYIQLSFSRGDLDWDNSGIPNVLRDAVVFYFFTPDTYLTFGQSKLPGNRQRVISSGMQQFAERSILNTRFNIDRDFGVKFNHQFQITNQHFRKQVALTMGEGRNAIVSDNGLAYTSRMEWLPLGEFTSDGDYFEGDLLREPKPKLSLGGAFSYNERAIRTGGQIGQFLESPTDIRTLIIDGIFKYQGFSLYGEYFFRNATRFIVNDQSGENTFIYSGKGAMLQTSYLFKNGYEYALRFATIEPLTAIKPFTSGDTEATFGISKYLKNHQIKAQFNIGYYNNHFLFAERNDNWFAQFQIEVGL